jgi:hypothetical protein
MTEWESPEASRLRVLYLAGFGRSGSSILGNVLGQTVDFFHGGEMRNIWDDGFVLNRVCGCGLAFVECPFWQVVATRIIEEEGIDPGRVRNERNRLGRTRQLPFWLIPGLRGRVEHQARELVGWIESTYRVIQEESGATVLVDSTMAPVYGYLLAQAPAIDLRVIHLIRDPRAVAFSWSKEVIQETTEGVPMRRFDPRASATRWVVENRAVAMLLDGRAKIRRYRYEDFAAEPARVVSEIVDFASDGLSNSPAFRDHRVVIEPSHTVWGNHSRFLTGEVEIRSDEAWRTDFEPTARRWVELITGGTARQFGYR